ncbi:hypothetical protein CALVIDRAFT_243228 [Calocera viscosa TUFC12733]|uniref:Uncharacterized protein n=1 Tax=Calocera viscosa (strain TUFC12733) TaxID=1330018 RepID=A0A167JQ55_CALVF|nr:hypothetical protein CALVIDRAFT_243228 [Calocera viscosa TUFC12733]
MPTAVTRNRTLTPATTIKGSRREAGSESRSSTRRRMPQKRRLSPLTVRNVMKLDSRWPITMPTPMLDDVFASRPTAAAAASLFSHVFPYGDIPRVEKLLDLHGSATLFFTLEDLYIRCPAQCPPLSPSHLFQQPPMPVRGSPAFHSSSTSTSAGYSPQTGCISSSFSLLNGSIFPSNLVVRMPTRTLNDPAS